MEEIDLLNYMQYRYTGILDVSCLQIEDADLQELDYIEEDEELVRTTNSIQVPETVDNARNQITEKMRIIRTEMFILFDMYYAYRETEKEQLDSLMKMKQ